MPSLVTFGEMKTRARQHADMVNSRFVGDSELGTYINSSCQDLYDQLIQAGELYYVSQGTIALSSGVDTYSLPSDFYKMLGVDLDSNGEMITLKKFEFAERNKYSFYPFYNSRNPVSYKYLIQGDSIRFMPQPTGSDNVVIWYAPTMPPLVNDSDTFDAINGWEDFVCIDSAIKMVAKEEGDISNLLTMKNDIEKKIQKMKTSRDQGGQYKISDVSGDTIYNKFGVEW